MPLDTGAVNKIYIYGGSVSFSVVQPFQWAKSAQEHLDFPDKMVTVRKAVALEEYFLLTGTGGNHSNISKGIKRWLWRPTLYFCLIIKV